VRCLILQTRSAALILFAALTTAACATVPLRLAAQDPPASDDQVQAPSSDDQDTSQAPYTNLSKEQLQRLVAPIALYPDSLVAQVLAACTFPSQIVDAEAFVKAHQGVSAKDLGTQANDQPWDNSVKALIQFPNVLANLASNLGWTSELGDAYYNQQKDVMDAVQVMRHKAKNSGSLQSNEHETVQDNDNHIEIEPADPQIVYVPAYDPWAVYGYPIAPWPYWVATPGIWWGGPGLYFGVGFPIAPFFGFGWGWGAWGVDWYGHGIWYHHDHYFARGGDFYDRRGYYGGRGDFNRGNGYRGGPGGGHDRGFSPGRPERGATGGYDHGGAARGYSARGQQSMGGFHGGGFRGGGFHGGGGGHR
jgi:hypothetical protein